MMTKPRVLAPRARRERPSAAATARQVPLTPARIGFLGSAQIEIDGGKSLLVRTLCWPSVPGAWNTLTQAWGALSSGRGEATGLAANRPPSWIRACAPQLGALFGETAAEETSVAALVQRSPMQIAVAIVDARERRSASVADEHARRHALAGCLAHYDDFVRKPGREACTTLVARGQGPESDRCELEDLADYRTRLPDARWLSALQLRFWSDAIEPLPLEIAHVVAAAIARQRLDADAANPIFAAALTKLSHDHASLRLPAKPRRR